MNINLNQTWKRLSMGAATLLLGAAALQAQISITVQVDMNDLVGTFTTVHAPGSWNGFDPSLDAMTDLDGDNIYEVTYTGLTAGTDYIYKFVTDASYSNEETVPSDCGEPNGFGTFDRVINAGMDTTADAVCFGSCVSCAATVNVNVTFIVNMDNEITSGLGAHIAGDMNGFTPTVMDDTDGDDVWEITYNLTAGNDIQYKYLNSNDFADGEVGDSLCGIDNGFGAFDRTFTVPTSDTTIGPVCFNECSDCVTTCDASTAPQNPASSVSPSTVALSWEGIPNSVACQIKAEQLIPPGPSPSANVISPEAQGFNVPVSLLGVNTTWKWQTRCACSISPVVASPLSVEDTFATVSAPRLANTIETELFPNPATDRITVQAAAQNAGPLNWTVVDVLGQVALTGQVSVLQGNNTFALDLTGLSNGMYFLRLQQQGEESVRSFSVER